MTIRPIIFSAPMILALLAGRKTQTRRLAKSPLAKCQVGDRLWVRENWYAAHSADDVAPRHMASDWVICWAADYNYAATGIKGKLRPSIHMPRWASRLTLTVTGVKVEKLKEISEEDARAEGSPPDYPHGPAINWFYDIWTGL